MIIPHDSSNVSGNVEMPKISIIMPEDGGYLFRQI